jgi:hypothetical protein
MRMALIFAVTIFAQTSGFAQKPDAARKEGTAGQSSAPSGIEAQADACNARKFETTVEVIADGKKRSSQVKLCGKEGQTDADWANTLKDAAKKVEANEKMPKAVKGQIISALNAEVAKLESSKAEPVQAVTNVLPAVPKPPAERPPEYSVLPPIPTAPAVPARSALAKQAPLLPKPRLSVQCMTPAELGGGSCESLRRNSVLTIRADENLVGGARLRFLRDGNFRDEMSLAPMPQGQSRRFKLPPKICAGAYRTTLKIEILAGSANGAGANAAADTLGPYQVRC